MAVIGVILNAIDIKRFKVFSMIAYIGMLKLVTSPSLTSPVNLSHFKLRFVTRN